MISLNRAIIILALILSGAASIAGENELEFGSNSRLDGLFATLQTKDGANAEREILLIFRQSGSSAMDLLLARGYGAVAEGRFTEAVWHFSALIDHAPDFAEAYNARASAFFDLGEYGLAMQDIQEALARNPRQFVSLSGLGAIQEELGNLDEALSAYRAAFSLDPHLEGLSDAIERVESQISILH